MGTIRFEGEFSFIDKLKKEGVDIISFTVKDDKIFVQSVNAGSFWTTKGNYIALPPKGELERKAKDKEQPKKRNKRSWKVGDDEPLAEVFIEYAAYPGHESKTFDDFFNDVGVPEDARSDFAVAALLRQVEEIENARV